MENQTIFNIVFGLSGFLGAYVLNSISTKLSDLQKADDALMDKVQRMEVLVAGEYVKHADLDKLIGTLFNKLDKIEAKLDSKADKP